MFTRDDATADLLRRAAAMKDAGSIATAVLLLEQAKLQMIDSPVHFPAETWCKLPLYLEFAGRADEALSEIEWLLEDLPRRAHKESFMDDPTVSFGKGVSKRSIYNRIVKTSKVIYERKRDLILKRIEKRSKAK